MKRIVIILVLMVVLFPFECLGNNLNLFRDICLVGKEDIFSEVSEAILQKTVGIKVTYDPSYSRESVLEGLKLKLVFSWERAFWIKEGDITRTVRTLGPGTSTYVPKMNSAKAVGVGDKFFIIWIKFVTFGSRIVTVEGTMYGQAISPIKINVVVDY